MATVSAASAEGCRACGMPSRVMPSREMPNPWAKMVRRTGVDEPEGTGGGTVASERGRSMSEGAIIALAALVFGWAVLARPLERTGVSAPMLFVAAGLLLGNGHIHDVTVNIDATTIRVLAEITLALGLFSDASSIDPEQLRHDAAWPFRLLAIGLPVSIALGTVVGFVVLPHMTWILAILVAAVLAATDASLSATVISDTRIAERSTWRAASTTGWPLRWWSSCWPQRPPRCTFRARAPGPATWCRSWWVSWAAYWRASRSASSGR